MQETPTPEQNRLFFALWPSEEIRARITKETDALCARHSFGGRRIKPDRYHQTLKFLGDDVPEVLEAAVLKAAARIEAPPFSLRLNLAGSFSKNGKIPIWLGPSEMPAELYHLDEALHRALGKRPRKRQPSLKPHVTIFRDAKEPLPVEPITPIDWRIEEFVLIRSILQHPAHYDILQRWPLRGGPLPPEPRQFSLLSA